MLAQHDPKAIKIATVALINQLNEDSAVAKATPSAFPLKSILVPALGVENPGPALTLAWEYFCGIDARFRDLRIKQNAQGLTPAEEHDLAALGVACLAANQVVDALIDARDGLFNPPAAYAGYTA